MAESNNRRAWSAMSRALRYRNYRLFFFGQGTSLIGTWLTRVALSWWVYRLTGSELVLGVVAFAGQIPTFLLAPLGGVIVDRYSRHRVLLVTQSLAMLQTALLTLLSLSPDASVGAILALAVFQGVINAFDTPARQAFVVEMVEAPEDLANAIALNSSIVNGARLLGPSFAGVLIATFGETGCFAIDTASYAAVLASLLAMRVRERPLRARSARVVADLVAGLRYALGSPPIRSLLALVALVSLTSMPYTVLMPVFADRVLDGGPGTLGALMGAAGVGALGGALWLAARPSVLGLGRVIAFAASTFGVALMLFSLSRTLWLSLPLVTLVGAGMMIQLASSNTILQTIVDEDKRGRVMSLYTMALFGMVPFGSLLAGLLASSIGATATLLVGGAVTLLGGLAFLRKLPELRRVVRPIYARKGILSDVATSLDGPG